MHVMCICFFLLETSEIAEAASSYEGPQELKDADEECEAVLLDAQKPRT